MEIQLDRDEAGDLSKRRRYLWLGLILVLSTALRLVRLGGQSFWWDEVYSATLAAKSLETVIPRFGQTPTLYHVLLHFWMYLGRSDAIIRLLSAITGIAAVWVMYLLGRRLLGDRQGLLAALLVAFSPFHVWYSQEARMYSLLILLSTASLLFFVKLLQERGGWSALWWVLTTGLAVYTHYYAAFLPLCQVVFFLLYRQRYGHRRRQFGLGLAGLALVAVPIFSMFLLSKRLSTICSIGAGGNPVHLFSIPYTLFAFSLGFSYGPSLTELHRVISVVAVRPYLLQILPPAFLFSAVFALGVRSLWRQREKLVFLLLILGIPMLGAGLVSLLWPQISYNVRYVSVVLPAYGLILARGLQAPRRRIVKVALTLLLFAFMFISLYNHYFESKYAKEDYRSAALLISSHTQEGDVVLVTHTMPFRYYYRGPLPTRTFFWSPTFYRRILGVQLHGYRRAWFVLSRDWGSDPDGRMSEYMKNTFPAVKETTFANLYLGLFDLSEARRDKAVPLPRRKGR